MVGLLFLITYVLDFIFLLTSIILAYLFFRKYIEVKKDEVLYFGLSILTAGLTLTGIALLGNTINLTSYQLPFIIHYFPFGLYPLAAIFYIKSISTLIIKEIKNRKIIMVSVIILSLTLMLSYYILFFLDTNNIGYIGEEDGIFHDSFFTNTIFTPIASLLVLVGSLVFVYKALRTKEPVSQLKGKFILVAVILLIISALSGFLTELGVPQEIKVIVNTTTRVLGFIFLYLGFILPDSLREIFLK